MPCVFDRPVVFPREKITNTSFATWFDVTYIDKFTLPNRPAILNNAKLSAIAEYIERGHSEPWMALRPMPATPDAASTQPSQTTNNAFTKYQFWPAFLLVVYYISGIALWARYIVGLFSFFVTQDQSVYNGIAYAGHGDWFGIADTCFAGGVFNTFSLAWWVRWIVTILTLPVFLSFVALSYRVHDSNGRGRACSNGRSGSLLTIL